jgi:hypothetical protein
VALENTFVKTPFKVEKFTDDQVRELALCAQNPVYFVDTYCWVQHPTKGKVPFKLFDYQRELIDCYHNNRYSINMLGRQMGKTACAAAYLVWRAMFMADQTILIAAHKFAGAQEIMQRVRYTYETLPTFLKAGATSYNKGSIDFDNGSRIISTTTTETTARGMSLSLIYCDEFAFVKPRIASEFWTSISPTLSTGGKCIITSTPNQDDDQFAQIWKESNKNVDEYGNPNASGLGRNGFAHIKFIWSAHPDRDETWAQVERSKIGEERFLREHECEFIIADETLINPMKLVTMEGKDPSSKMGQIRVYKFPERNGSYVIGWDPSLGTGGDPAAIQIYKIPEMEQIAEWQHNKTDMQGQLRTLVAILKWLKDETGNNSELYWSVENNTIGEAALISIREFGEENIPGTFVQEIRKAGQSRGRRGFNTSHKTKISACMRLKNYVEADKMTIRSHNLLRELKNFIARGPSFAAKDGETDDLVMATLLVIRIVEVVMTWDIETYEKLVNYGAEDILKPMPIGFF